MRKNVKQLMSENSLRLFELVQAPKFDLNAFNECLSKCKKEDVNAVNAFGKRLLCFAAWNCGFAPVVQLIAKGAEVNGRDSNGDTALHHAVRGGNLDVVNSLLAANADVNLKNNIGDVPLHLAGFIGNLDVVKALVDKGAIVNGSNALHSSAIAGHKHVVQYLLENGAKDHRVNCYSAFSLAEVAGNKEIAEMIMAANRSEIQK